MENEEPKLLINCNFNDSIKKLLENTNINKINELFLQSHGLSNEDSDKIMQEKHSLSNKECIFECGNLRKVLCVPCGHLCLCSDCFQKHNGLPKKCPFCNKKVDTFVTLNSNV